MTSLRPTALSFPSSSVAATFTISKSRQLRKIRFRRPNLQISHKPLNSIDPESPSRKWFLTYAAMICLWIVSKSQRFYRNMRHQ